VDFGLFLHLHSKSFRIWPKCSTRFLHVCSCYSLSKFHFHHGLCQWVPPCFFKTSNLQFLKFWSWTSQWPSLALLWLSSLRIYTRNFTYFWASLLLLWPKQYFGSKRFLIKLDLVDVAWHMPANVEIGSYVPLPTSSMSSSFILYLPYHVLHAPPLSLYFTL
jgi:hypothetical protein